MSKARLMQGNQACAEGMIAAGVRFFAGYPITPSTEVAEILAEELPKLGGKFIQMEDEIGSMGAVLGASLTGDQSHHRHQRTRLLAEAGTHRLRLHGGNPLRRR